MKATNRIFEMVPHIVGDAYDPSNLPYVDRVRTGREHTFRELQIFATNNKVKGRFNPSSYYEDT